MMEFILSHQALMAALLVAIADFVFAVSPGLASNGILHSLYLAVKGKAGSA